MDEPREGDPMYHLRAALDMLPERCKLCNIVLDFIRIQCPGEDSHVFCVRCTKAALWEHVREEHIGCPTNENCEFIDFHGNVRRFRMFDIEIMYLMRREEYARFSRIRSELGFHFEPVRVVFNDDPIALDALELLNAPEEPEAQDAPNPEAQDAPNPVAPNAPNAPQD